MANKLSPDYIELVLKLNASQVQEEYHRLEKAMHPKNADPNKGVNVNMQKYEEDCHDSPLHSRFQPD